MSYLSPISDHGAGCVIFSPFSGLSTRGKLLRKREFASHWGWAIFCLIKIYHYCDVIMGTVAAQITSLTIVYSTVYSDADQRKHQSSASLPFVRGIHRWPVNSPHKWPVTRKMFPFDDVIMCFKNSSGVEHLHCRLCMTSTVYVNLHNKSINWNKRAGHK